MKSRNTIINRVIFLSLLLVGLGACAGRPPTEAQVYYNKGLASSSGPSGRDGMAIIYYNKAIELDPDLYQAFNNRGLAHKRLGHYDQSIRDLTEAIRLNPSHAMYYHNRGGAYVDMGLHDKAIADTGKAISMFENSENRNEKRLAEAHHNRQISYRGKGDYERAIADVTKAIDLWPGLGAAYNDLAWMRATLPDAALRDGKMAVRLAEQAVKYDGGPHTLDTLAAAYAEAGKFKEAVDTQLRAINSLGSNADKKLLLEFKAHLDSYQNHKPWRMSE